MSEKITLQDIIELLAEKHGMTKKDADIFVRGMFELIEEALATEKYVKVKGLGTFKLTEVESRESVHINTGERIAIQGHTKISFTPDTSMKDLINKPFAHFETVILNENTELADTETEIEGEEAEEKEDYAAESAEEITTAEVITEEVVTGEAIIADEMTAVTEANEIEILSAEEKNFVETETGTIAEAKEEVVAPISEEEILPTEPEVIEETEVSAEPENTPVLVSEGEVTGSPLMVEETVSVREETSVMEPLHPDRETENILSDIEETPATKPLCSEEETKEAFAVIEETPVSETLHADEESEETVLTSEETVRITEEENETGNTPSEEILINAEAESIMPTDKGNTLPISDISDETDQNKETVEEKESQTAISSEITEEPEKPVSLPTKETETGKPGTSRRLIIVVIFFILAIACALYWYLSTQNNEQHQADTVLRETASLTSTPLEEASDSLLIQTQTNDTTNAETEGTSDSEKIIVPETQQATPVSSGTTSGNKEIAKVTLADTVEYDITGTKTNYTLKEGESLIKVAVKFYGSKNLWPYIVKHNKDIIKNADRVPIGTTLRIPELVPKKQQ